ncbi:hypothetical protein [Micromonospora rifamycinica]|uniref:Ricin B lectin domain-containing protein n=1 Tax=Micromonospora rifamycinica TaxID=291594 RepID=A0A109IIK7_9ACTN|nr:hypothetical protein [Micromonospora rifamycinica]KWV31186.1 hypothetical protein AWV63_18980 [Micromonospora rifamycinica]SCG38199.1 hypothetical protein GA0070623_0409 [Micromonospora rifamycinica]
MSMKRWFTGAGLLALTGALAACAVDTRPGGGDVPPAPVEQPVVAVPAGLSATPPKTSTAPRGLSGNRQYTIVRVGAFEGGLSLTDSGRLAEVDDDQGRQLFVPTPVGGQRYLLKAYSRSSAGPLCWRVHNPGNTQPLVVQAATCKADDPRQQFEIMTAAGTTPSYLISSAGAFLRHSSRYGLILEELGDAEPTSSFRFNDNGPAPVGR